MVGKWQVDNGKFLMHLRQELLDRAAEEAAPAEPEERQRALSPRERHARLKEAREAAEAGQPVSLSVQELLDWWGVTGRGLVNGQIKADLANHSRVTSPGFDKVPLASTLMLLHDFSQLPVLTGPHDLRGVISWKSIARTRHADRDAHLSQAVVDARDVRYDHDLIDVLPTPAEHDFVLVRDQNNAIAGIVTAADVAQAYGDLAAPSC